MYLADSDICKKLFIYGNVKRFFEKFPVQVDLTELSGRIVGRGQTGHISNEPEIKNDCDYVLAVSDNCWYEGRRPKSSRIP